MTEREQAKTRGHAQSLHRRCTPLKALLLWGLLACSAAAAPPPVEQGRRLFAGEPPMVARLAGHTELLPVESSRCTNCHLAGASTVAAVPDKFGPTLNARFLRSPAARRGGPASSYDGASFCRLLREGIDPASVMLLPAMPRYELSDAQCSALWAYLVRPVR